VNKNFYIFEKFKISQKSILKVNNLFELTRTIFEEETYTKMTDTFNDNKFCNWIFVQNELFETRLNNNFYTLIRLLFFKCYVNFRLLIDDIDEDKIGSSKSIALSSLSVSD